MPLYEYECGKCNQSFEVLQKFSEAGQAACPTCNSEAQRKLSQSSFQLKGGGWYNDGYKGGTSASAAAPSAAPASAPKSCGGSCACAS